jgi:hypothetical protein
MRWMCAREEHQEPVFSKRDSKAEGVLELIHSDVCGPMPSSSISGYIYYVSFIDDYSRKDLDIFEVFRNFKEFKALIENLFEKKMEILRSDNRGEYTSKEFVNFCKNVGSRGNSLLPIIPNKIV